jgi:hypothetical protein
MQTLLGVKHLARKGDYLFSFDMHDCFYALGINPADRDYFTLNVRGQLYRPAGLPLGWSLSPFYFFKMTPILFRESLVSTIPTITLPDSR